MHGFYLHMFQCHIHDIWGMNIKLADGLSVPDLDIDPEMKS